MDWSAPFGAFRPETNCHPSITDPSFNISNGLFDISKKKSKDYYSMLVSTKAKTHSCI